MQCVFSTLSEDEDRRYRSERRQVPPYSAYSFLNGMEQCFACDNAIHEDYLKFPLQGAIGPFRYAIGNLFPPCAANGYLEIKS